MERYLQPLKELKDWEPYLLQESRLPGPRANLELAQAVAEAGDREIFYRLLASGQAAPANTPGEFLAVCGVIGLGRLLADGDRSVLTEIRRCAVEFRWRLREGAAMALQRWGEVDMESLLTEISGWAQAGPLERRAAAAALCEPKLLRRPEHTRRVLEILDRITASLPAETDRRSVAFQALRKGLAYCWSVAVAADLEAGKPVFEKWAAHPDKDVRWIVQENLKKNRLLRLDPDWAAALQRKNAQA